MKKVIWVLAGLMTIVVIALLGFVAYTQIATAGPDQVAEAALRSSSDVQVESGDWLLFQPAGEQPTTGLVFYPGGLVDAQAYAPFAQDIAAQGYLVAIPSMPLNLAVLGIGQAQEVIDAHPQIQHWAVGGHSLGGAMAAQFIKDYPRAAEGLVLWGAYPSGNTDISCRVLQAASIYGTHDGLSSPEEIEATKELLPPETVYVALEGGNHAQFGYYGPQRGDLDPELSQQEQRDQVVKATIDLLSGLGG
jgi:dienelactone hydrolase